MVILSPLCLHCDSSFHLHTGQQTEQALETHKGSLRSSWFHRTYGWEIWYDYGKHLTTVEMFRNSHAKVAKRKHLHSYLAFPMIDTENLMSQWPLRTVSYHLELHNHTIDPLALSWCLYNACKTLSNVLWVRCEGASVFYQGSYRIWDSVLH